ncbi:MAG: hypothetical protein WC219_05330 [Acholeplasmataceae bacterium]
MRKIVVLMMMFLFIVLSGCEDEEITPDLINYDLEVESFESFFNIAYRIIPGDVNEIEIKISTKEDYQMIDVDVEISIYYEYVYDENIIKDRHQVDINISETTYTYEKALEVGSNHQLVGLTVDDVDGYIKFSEDITIESKSYEAPYVVDDIDVPDMQENLSVYDELKEKLNEADQKMSNNYRSVTTTTQEITMDYETFEIVQTATVDALKDPFYLKMSDDVSDLIITTHQDQSLMYSWDGEYYIDHKMLTYTMLSDEDVEFYKALTFGSEDDYMFLNPTKLIFEKTLNGFKVTGQIKDLLDPDMLEDIIDDELDDMFSQTMTMEITFSLNSMSVKTEFSMELDETFKMDTEIIETYYYNDAHIINLNDQDEFYISYPSEIDTVLTETNFLDVFYQDEPGIAHAYKGYLEKGFYEYDDFGSRYNVFFYNEEGQIIAGPSQNSDLNSDVFEIEQDGYYYIRIMRSNYDYYEDYRFQLIDLDLNDFVETPLTLEEGVVSNLHVESIKDIVKVEFEVDDISLVVFNFDISSGVTIFYDYVNDQMISDYAKDTYEFGAKPGKNTIYIKASTEVTGTVSFEKTTVPYVYTRNVDQMIEVQTSYFDSDFFYGGQFGRAYLKLEVTETLNYKFYLKSGYATLYRVDTDAFYSINQFYNQGEMVLNPNTYVIIFNSNDISRNNIYYESYVYEAIPQTIEIKHYEYQPNLIGSMDKINTLILTKGQYKIYVFTLDSDSDILYYASNTKLINDAGEVINLYDEDIDPGYNNQEIYHLKAGTYQIIQDSSIESNSVFYTIEIGIIENLPVDDNENTEPYTITNRGTVTLIKDHTYDNELIKLVITEAGTYHFTSSRSFRFIYEGEAAGHYGTNLSYDLEVGTYYIYHNGIYYDDESFTVTVS